MDLDTAFFLGKNKTEEDLNFTCPIIVVATLCIYKLCDCCFVCQEEDEERKGDKTVSSRSERMAHPLAECLDVLMTILFSYIKDVCHVGGKNT